jgi:hypothetical protein
LAQLPFRPRQPRAFCARETFGSRFSTEARAIAREATNDVA